VFAEAEASLLCQTMTDNNALRQRRTSALLGTKTAFGKVRVESPDVVYTADCIKAKYTYRESRVRIDEASGAITAVPTETDIHFSTELGTRRTGLLQVGWGGNNGTTVTGAVLAKRLGIKWESRNGSHAANYNGALTQAATLRIGVGADGKDVFVPFSSVLPMVNPDDFVLGGWDISGRNLADAMDAAQVFEPDLRRQLRPHMESMTPLAASFDPDFIAKNQRSRADNLIASKIKADHLRSLREDIVRFKQNNNLQFTVVVWTANSERYSVESEGVNDTAENLMAAIQSSHPEVSPSTLYCVAAILEGCPYINGSPQNTFVPGVIELAHLHGVPICGDDFKSGQTKMKSVLADYLIGCGIKIKTMVTYNHLGNNDMYQLTDEVMWRPKSASKSRVIEDIVDANGLLYASGDPGPDHVVVVKYVPFLGDSKRDVSEYTSETFMDVHYTSIMHNECLDSALCAPLILDLAIFAELFSRVTYAREGGSGCCIDKKILSPVLSVLGFYMKIPRTPAGEPVVNALGRQKSCIENMLRALVGLAPENNLFLDTKCQ
jgi:myo-inositol-1-phosphate synthase